VARELLGQVLPSWEPCNEINPDVERIPVTRVAQSANGVAPQPASEVTPEPSLEVFTEESELISDSASAHTGLRSLSDLSTTTPTETTGTVSKLTIPAVESDLTVDNSSVVTPPSPTLPASDSLASAPEVINSVSPDKHILDPKIQPGGAEKNIAKLLHQAELASKVLKGEDFYLKVENQPFTPLTIERHGKELYLTHYLADDYGDLFLDAEMVFNVSAQRQLTLTQTASQNPLTGGEYRTNGDRSFGQIFSRNLIEQGFGAAALSANQTKQQSASVQEQALVEVENLHLPAPGKEQIPVEVKNLQQTEAPQQLKKAAVALKADEQPLEQAPAVATADEQPLEQAPAVATVVNNPIKKLSRHRCHQSRQQQLNPLNLNHLWVSPLLALKQRQPNLKEFN
jgi:hypothetical protein